MNPQVLASVTQEPGLDGRLWWVADIVGGGATQARSLRDIPAQVAEVVRLRDGLADDAKVDVLLHVS